MSDDMGTSAAQTALGSADGHPSPTSGLGPSGAIASAGLAELAERCEKATGPDEVHSLLSEAWSACFPRSAFPTGAHRDNARWHFKRLLEVGAYLDAAMTLVPEGWTVELTAPPANSQAPNYAKLWRTIRATGYVRAATPALALCAAALRAQAATR